MAQGARATQELRRAVGRALRGVREKGSFSLDDLARASREEGVNVSRSHLSRVENGEADLSLPRFLVLMRVLGEARDAVLDDLDARLAAGSAPLETLLSEARAFRSQNEHERSVERISAAFVSQPEALDEDDLGCWLRAEAALGRWRSAARVAQLRLSRRGLADEGVALMEGAVALLGSGQLRAALAFSRAALPHGEARARATEGAGLLALDRPAAALERADSTSLGSPLRLGEGLALIVASGCYRAIEKPRAAVHAAGCAVEMDLPEPARAEARLALARAEGALRRPRGTRSSSCPRWSTPTRGRT